MRPILCGKCGYDLTGLPGVGNCPECGQRYWVTRGQGIGKGDSAETRGSRFIRRGRTILLAVAGVLIFAAGLVVQAALKRKNAFLTGAIVGGSLMVCAVMSYLLEKDD